MLILIVILYLLLASTFTAAKAALQYAPPLFLVGIRMTLAGFILLTYYNYRYKTAKNRENITKDWKLFLAVALFHIYITYVLDFWSLQYMTSGKSAFIYSLSPFAAALFSYLVYGQTLTFGQKLSIILGFLSITPILLSSTQTTDLLGIGVPELALLVAMFSGTYAWILVRKLMD
ncbi:MAG TPA: DMT family transporter, partial [Candidatus Babeliaceae bacterium]|nr:DMT family transporter [Candidatus Babeliaceae bacterium]